MKNTFSLCMLVGALLIVSSCGSDTSEPPITSDPFTVSMPADVFIPFTMNINVGGSVIFDFPSRSHNVIFTRVTGAPADIQETTNKKVSRTFNVAGNFPYECTIHPGMDGVVVVK